MTKREAREFIYRELCQVLVDTDFRLSRSDEGFVRMIPGGRQQIGLAFYDYHPRYEFTLVMSIRIDAAEKIIHPFTGTPPEYQSGTVTTGLRLDHFTGDPTRYKVKSEEDIRETVARLAPVVRDGIFPFLNSHQDAAALDQIMNRSERPPTIPMQPYRGMHAIIVAKLAGNPDFDRLVELYLDEMKTVAAQDREKFIRLVEHLKSMP